MQLQTGAGTLKIVDERTYSFRSVDNLRIYPVELNLARESRPCVIVGLLLDGQPTAVIGSDRGVEGVYEQSAVVVSDRVFVAVGNQVVCARLQPFEVLWSLEADRVACFGVYHKEERNALIAHGELAVSRISHDGRILWSASGADVFTGAFELLDDRVRAKDLDGKVYEFDYSSGRPLLT